jgi:hypothetical protein
MTDAPGRGAAPGGTAPSFHALLIGIDCYLPNELPGGVSYDSLTGAVRDTERVAQFLRRTLGIPDARLTTLTARDRGDGTPAEPADHWPTYENVVSAFQAVTAAAAPGDQVHVHYSGHGGRAKTAFPELRGDAGVDEAFVPMNIGQSEARYLRDVELSRLLAAMVDKGLIVSVVLDCCHAGGMTRGVSRARVRGSRQVDTAARPTGSLAGSRDELLAMWPESARTRSRGSARAPVQLPEPEGYTLLAACRPQEEAYEDWFDDTGSAGALTYWWLDSLRDLGPGLSWKILHERIYAKIHAHFETQTPQLQGEGDRVVFGSARVEPHYAALVVEVEDYGAERRVRINAGQAHGLAAGARFAVYPPGSTAFRDPSTAGAARQALVRLTDAGAVSSWAAITKRLTPAPIEQGAQAVLLGSGTAQLVRKVGVVRTGVAPDSHAARALDAVEAALAGSGWIEVSADGRGIAWQVAVNDLGELEVWDSAGVVIRNLRPPLRIDEADAAPKVARRLEHLARYTAVRTLHNHDSASPIARGLEAQLVTDVAAAGSPPVLAIGDRVALRIRNRSSRVLNVAVLDLRPDWSVTQVYPPGAGDSFVSLDPGEERQVRFRAGLPEGYTEGTDVLKVFATLGTTGFRWLELPALDRPRAGTPRSRGPQDGLESLFAALASDRPATRHLTVERDATGEWLTELVEVHVRSA